MEELFKDITEEQRAQVKMVADTAFSQNDPMLIVKLLNNYTKNCATDYERDFAEFYFNMRMEQLK